MFRIYHSKNMPRSVTNPLSKNVSRSVTNLSRTCFWICNNLSRKYAQITKVWCIALNGLTLFYSALKGLCSTPTMHKLSVFANVQFFKNQVGYDFSTL
jgi:hypothetical protein